MSAYLYGSFHLTFKDKSIYQLSCMADKKAEHYSVKIWEKASKIFFSFFFSFFMIWSKMYFFNI